MQHTPSGDLTRRVYCDFKRLGGRDVVLLKQGAYPPFGDPLVVEGYEVVCFDVKVDAYKAFLPGYRLFTDEGDTSQLVAVERPDGHTLAWSAGLDDGGRRRTIVTLVGAWVERIERVSPDGATCLLSDMRLVRSPA